MAVNSPSHWGRNSRIFFTKKFFSGLFALDPLVDPDQARSIECEIERPIKISQKEIREKMRGNQSSEN